MKRYIISINCNDPNILKFLEENISKLSSNVLIREKNLLTLKLDFLSYENDIKISSPNQETTIISKPFHFSQMISKINIFQQNYSVKIAT